MTGLFLCDVLILKLTMMLGTTLGAASTVCAKDCAKVLPRLAEVHIDAQLKGRSKGIPPLAQELHQWPHLRWYRGPHLH